MDRERQRLEREREARYQGYKKLPPSERMTYGDKPRHGIVNPQFLMQARQDRNHFAHRFRQEEIERLNRSAEYKKTPRRRLLWHASSGLLN